MLCHFDMKSYVMLYEKLCLKIRWIAYGDDDNDDMKLKHFQYAV